MHGTETTRLRQPGYMGGTIDRVDHIRTNPQLLAQTLADPAACRLILDGLDPVECDGHLAMEPLPAGVEAADHALLGIDRHGRPIFAALNGHPAMSPNATAASRGIVGAIPAEEVAIYGAARSLIHWHARHGFCSVCGGATRAVKAGWSRHCDDCGADHFPRTDPVVIMLAEHRGRVLVGRQHSWAQGRYSALAGFVEPGETIEEAVARELFEEAGVRVRDVRYLMSQPWPFPSSLMIACIAQADDDALTLDETEIEAAFWVDADGVRAALAEEEDAPFQAPPPMAVAWHLLDQWLAGVAPSPASA